jgi:hypothetical protein
VDVGSILGLADVAVVVYVVLLLGYGGEADLADGCALSAEEEIMITALNGLHGAPLVSPSLRKGNPKCIPLVWKTSRDYDELNGSTPGGEDDSQ